jgi:hypothetical protein
MRHLEPHGCIENEAQLPGERHDLVGRQRMTNEQPIPFEIDVPDTRARS